MPSVKFDFIDIHSLSFTSIYSWYNKISSVCVVRLAVCRVFCAHVKCTILARLNLLKLSASRECCSQIRTTNCPNFLVIFVFARRVVSEHLSMIFIFKFRTCTMEYFWHVKDLFLRWNRKISKHRVSTFEFCLRIVLLSSNKMNDLPLSFSFLVVILTIFKSIAHFAVISLFV